MSDTENFHAKMLQFYRKNSDIMLVAEAQRFLELPENDRAELLFYVFMGITGHIKEMIGGVAMTPENAEEAMEKFSRGSGNA